MTDTLIDDDETVTGSGSVDLVRQYEFRAEPSDDGLTLDGYAAVFNEPTEINSHDGHFYEQVKPGAFKRSIGQRTPTLLFNHGEHPLIGNMPIGVIRSIREDDHGLRVRARLSDNWLIQPVRDAIRDGAITGMSFRFGVINDTWKAQFRDGLQLRTLIELAVPELGPTPFPAYMKTSVGVRSRTTLTALEDPEVRAEIALILASGTDLRSLADVPAPADSHAETTHTDPAAGHSEGNQRQTVPVLALRALALQALNA